MTVYLIVGATLPCEARAHLTGEDDELAMVAPLVALIPVFAALLDMRAEAALTNRIARAPIIGRPVARRNGSRRVSAGSAGLSHPANPSHSRACSRTRVAAAERRKRTSARRKPRGLRPATDA